MFIRKSEDTVFGFGQVGEDKVIGNVAEFEYEDNRLIKTLSFPTYINQESGEVVYIYKDMILTFKELQKVYLSEYYAVK